jgi:hypothetical protein
MSKEMIVVKTQQPELTDQGNAYTQASLHNK